MKKLKKPKIIFIYGFIAVGKFTVAKELQKITKYKLVHNHMMTDLVCDIFGGERPWSFATAEAREWIELGLVERLVRANMNCIFTQAYTKDNITAPGVDNAHDFIVKLKRKVERQGGIFCPVYLYCDEKEMLKRLKNESRKAHGKLRTTKTMKELLKTKDSKTPINFQNGLVIDTTNISAKKSARMIKEHFNL
jgi:chloramphenicol 3-O-phosphotransferase